MKNKSINLDQKDEFWEKHWHNIENTVSERDIFYVIDTIKLQYALRHLPKKGTVLEVGGGSSRFSCFLAKRGYDTTILDYSNEALKVARNNYKILGIKGKFDLGDAHNLPYKDNSFDVVISTGLLEHFEDPQPIINEMTRVLKRGGLFFSDVAPKKFSSIRSLDFLYEKIYCRIVNKKIEEMYERKITKKQMRQMMENVNLRNVVVYSAYVLPPRVLLPSNLPILRKIKWIKRAEYRTLNFLIPVIKLPDKTIISDIFGLAYNCFGIKK
jgi:ubiquinone/menaquinone biosynthesis C-methylase UbiE